MPKDEDGVVKGTIGEGETTPEVYDVVRNTVEPYETRGPAEALLDLGRSSVCFKELGDVLMISSLGVALEFNWIKRGLCLSEESKHLNDAHQSDHGVDEGMKREEEAIAEQTARKESPDGANEARLGSGERANDQSDRNSEARILS